MNLQDLRIRRGQTLEDVAESLGVTRQQVNNWESGRALPPVKYVDRYAALLEIRAHTLLMWVNNQKLKRFTERLKKK